MILRSTTAVTRSTLLSVSTFSSAVPVPALRHHRYAHSKAQRWPAHSNAWNEETRHEREQQPLQVQVQTKSGKSQNQLPFGLPPPRHLVARLDEHVIGQARAKKYLAVAVYNHYLRVFSNEESEALALSESDDHLAGLKAEQQAENVNTRKQRKRGPRIDAGPECSSEEDHHTKQNDRIEANSRQPLSASYFSPSHLPFPREHRNDHGNSDHDHDRELSQTARRSRQPDRTADRPNVDPSTMSPFRSTDPSERLQTTPMLRHTKSNLLLLGPSGVGKTLLVSTVASLLRVPFITIDATPLTASGYVGDDVDMIAKRLVAEARRICLADAATNARLTGEDVVEVTEEDVVRTAQRGIVYIDEVDKLATRKAGSGSAATGSGRDIGGEAVQQALLRLLEGCQIQVQEASPRGGAPSTSSASYSGSQRKGPSSSGQSSHSPSHGPKSGAAMQLSASAGGSSGPSTGGSGPAPSASQQMSTYLLDTSSVLFVLSGAFVGIEDIVRQRIAPSSSPSKPTSPPEEATATDQDLIAYGLIPEFLGRIASLCTLQPLTEDELVRILVEPRNSLVEQYTSLLAASGVELRVSPKGLRALVRRAQGKDQTGSSTHSSSSSGARGLRRVMEDTLLDAMFLAPGGSIRFALLDEDAAAGRGEVRFWSRGGRSAFLDAWNEEEDEHSKPVVAQPEAQATAHKSAGARPQRKASVTSSRSGKTDATSFFSPNAARRPADAIRAQRYIDPASQQLIDEADADAGVSVNNTRASASGSSPSTPLLTKSTHAIARRKNRARLNRPSRVGNLRVSIG